MTGTKADLGLFPVIVAGGAGERLWPVSRESAPKPFIKLPDGESLMQKTFARAAALPQVEEILTVTNRELFFRTRDEYAVMNGAQLPLRFLLEPMGRNTAPAIAAAALQLQAIYGDDAVMLVLAADHLIADGAAFQASVAEAAQLAREGYLVTLGVSPEYAETGFGYIERADAPLPGTKAGYASKRFVEKPDAATAQAYLEAGTYLWNSGMFCFTAGALLAEMQAYAPEVLREVRLAVGNMQSSTLQGAVVAELEAKDFAQSPNISIDYAVMEHSKKVAVVECSIGWNDIGSWASLSELTPPNAEGNRVLGTAFFHEATNCYIQSESGRLVGAVGVDNLLVIDTADALLIADKSRAQDVKQIVKQLKASGHDASKLHRTVHRPWGTYTILEEGQHFKIKRIVVTPGAQLSMQMHHHRSEHWIIVQGAAKVTNGEDSFLVNTNESTYIPAGNKHRLENPGKIDLVMIEVQSGAYLGEDDIVRFEDKYGRAQGAEKAA